MKRNTIILSAVAGASLAGIAAFAALQGNGVWAQEVKFLGRSMTGRQIALGGRVYAKSCASCHGARLQGQPDWKRRLENGRMPAPPHDASGHTWLHADQDLFNITKRSVSAVVPGYESDSRPSRTF